MNSPLLSMEALFDLVFSFDTSSDEVQSIVSGKLALKYSGPSVDAMKSIAQASHKRSLADFQAVRLARVLKNHRFLRSFHAFGSFHINSTNLKKIQVTISNTAKYDKLGPSWAVLKVSDLWLCIKSWCRYNTSALKVSLITLTNRAYSVNNML